MQLNEIHNPHEHASVSLKVILLIFAVLLVGVLGYLVWDFKNTPDTTDNSATSTVTKGTDDTTTTETDETADWSTYTNSVFGIKLKHPTSFGVYTLSGEGPSATAKLATSESSYIFVSTGKETDGKFFVTDPAMGTLSETTIKQQFTKPENLIITSATIDNTPAYKIEVMNDSTAISTFYFAKNSSGKIIQLTVPNGDETSANIFKSIIFTN